MFYASISALDSEMLQSLSNAILCPPDNGKYKTLKEKVIPMYAKLEAIYYWEGFDSRNY